MTPLALLALQIVTSFAALVELVRGSGWYRRATPRQVLIALLWVHVPRFVPLGLLAPGQVGADVSRSTLGLVAWGDFAASALALLALARLRAQAADATAAVWLFSIVSTADIVVALTEGLGTGLYRHPLGLGWFVLVLYVPAVCVSQALLFSVLARSTAHPGSEP